MANEIHGRRPNVFLVGAPRAGTTAMLEYLRDHPYAYFSNPDEPHYWASDLPGLRKQSAIEKEEQYLALFANCTGKHRVIGEGSTLYLMSEKAIPQILEYAPDAKFAVMIRHPADLAYSFFRQLRRSLDEDVDEFEEAWHLQSQRRSRQSIPQKCTEKRVLQYKNVASLGRQIERAMASIDPQQLHLIFYEDFCNDPQRVYTRLLEFLDLPADDRRDFPRHSDSRSSSAAWLTQLGESRTVQKIAQVSNAKMTGRWMAWARRGRDALLARPNKDSAIRPQFRDKLVDEFREDIRLLASCTGRCLDHWMQRTPR